MEYYNESYNAFGVDYIWSVVDEWPTNAINVTDGEAEKKRSAYILLKQKISVLVYIIMAIRAAWKAKKKTKERKAQTRSSKYKSLSVLFRKCIYNFWKARNENNFKKWYCMSYFKDFNLIKITDTLIIQEYFIEKHKM